MIVTNPTGPGLLSLRLEGPPNALTSDGHFLASTQILPARRAREVGGAAPNPNAFTMPSPTEGLSRASIFSRTTAAALAATASIEPFEIVTSIALRLSSNASASARARPRSGGGCSVIIPVLAAC